MRTNSLLYDRAMDQRLDMLKLALRNLAAPADEQVQYLDELLGADAAAHGNDELAQELNDAFASHLDMRERGFLSEEQIVAIRPVDDLLGRLSGDGAPGFWKRDALATDDRWEQVRRAAQAALRKLEP